ncbi:acyl-CoA thioesterase [Streptomyces sp. NPDC056723]|uniref:acyl-CoA thioesterase n=1 Tax=Streptomyces sp. NPDC056723 TaxID=3345925 RepID=UPI0036AB0168
MYQTVSASGDSELSSSLPPGFFGGLVDFLSLERQADDLFRGWCHSGGPTRAFGGQVVAQALAAAGNTVEPGRPVHSLHGYFLRPGDVRHPIEYAVERLRDSRRFSFRRVTAKQGNGLVFTLSASFKYPEEVGDRQPAMPVVPPPDEVPDAFDHWAARHPEQHRRARYAHVVSMRVVPRAPDAAPVGATGEIEQLAWFRSREPLPDDQLLHACALTYYSDLSLGSTSALDIEDLYPLREGSSRLGLASLDHTVWFHRPSRADEWLLFVQRSRSATDGRGLTTGEFWTQDGRLVATATQETALRLLGPRT